MKGGLDSITEPSLDSSLMLVVGGSKGHVSETIEGNVLQLYHTFRWKMIPNCTGRYTCRDHKSVSTLHPLDVLGKAGIYKLLVDGGENVTNMLFVREFTLPGREDPILIVPLDRLNETGLITYSKMSPNTSTIENEQASNSISCSNMTASFVHTLNTKSGFRRKLEAVGIHVDDTDFWTNEK